MLCGPTSLNPTLRPWRAHNAQIPGSISYRAGQHCWWSSAAPTRDRGSCWINRLCPSADTPTAISSAMTTPSAADQLDEYPRRTELLGTASHRSWGCPLDIPVTGRIAGKPWRQAIDYANSRVPACYPIEHLVGPGKPRPNTRHFAVTAAVSPLGGRRDRMAIKSAPWQTITEAATEESELHHAWQKAGI